MRTVASGPPLTGTSDATCEHPVSRATTTAEAATDPQTERNRRGLTGPV
jgi:hypothetical protein